MRRIAPLMLVVLVMGSPMVAAQEKREIKKDDQTEKKKATAQQDAKKPATKKDKKGADGGWKVMFDGKSLKGWERAKGFDYDDKSKVDVKDGCIVLEMGGPATGVRWKGKFPKVNYEVRLEGKRVEGGDFFCGFSFPVGDGALTLILGGWGGWVTGVSCIDGYLAADNETCNAVEFENGRWYRIRVRVTDKKVEAWVDDEQIVELETADRKLTVTSEMEPCLPFGFATWYTTGALRKIAYRPLPKAKLPEKKKLP